MNFKFTPISVLNVSGFFLSLALTANVFALPSTPITTQSFEGKLQDGSNTKVHFVVKGPIPGMKESYMGFLLRKDPEIRVDVFRIDPDAKFDYTLTPVKVLDDGEVSVPSASPSNILTLNKPMPFSNANPFKVCADRKYAPLGFSITLSGSKSRDGVKTAAVFDGKCSSEAVLDALPGIYHAGNSTTNVTIHPLNSENEATVAFPQVGDLNGVFTLRQKQISLFNLRQGKATAFGTPTEQYPKKIGFFLRNVGWFCPENKFVLVDPRDNQRVTILKYNKIQN